ncbi:hypothetical protein [Pseudoclavibacter sp. VKM Ac-2867]|uniref:hypothetical protein n=1 Tax=Pseudoclavibacter sp. VKM Ac-2867 TaxID=2783829 RepID=UPI00188D6D93|nr:hypothetical protein [Pseudoclavibacter sp. VKM Ac-2867]MBF4457636.1 hypothetical protein [Pseudoclavibacter sp. VKM Ac-2867]
MNTPEHSKLTRRALVGTAVWTVPVIAVAAAAPLAAASPGRCGTLSWAQTTATNANTRTATVSTGGNAASLTIARATIAGTPLTGNFAPYTGTPGPVGPTGSLFMWQETATANVPARQRLTFTSSVPIRSVQFVIHDHTRSNEYSDGISIEGFTTRSAAFIEARPAGVNLTGAGSQASPWSNSAVHTTNATSRTQVTAQSPSASVTSFTVDYVNTTAPAVAGGGSRQYISLSDLEICF